MAIAVNSETRVLRMAAILDTGLLLRLFEDHVFEVLKIGATGTADLQRFEKVRKKMVAGIEGVVALE